MLPSLLAALAAIPFQRRRAALASLATALLLFPALVLAQASPAAPGEAAGIAPEAAEAPRSPSAEPETAEGETTGTADAATADEAVGNEAGTMHPKGHRGSDKLDTVEVLQGGSGVRVQQICTNCNQASLTVNGVTGSEHLLVEWDGMPAVGGLGTVYHTIQTPSELIGYSHVVRGPGSVLSGPSAMGGLLEFHSAKRDAEPNVVLDMRASDFGAQTLRVGGTDRWGPVGALIWAQGSQSNAVDGSGDGYSELPEVERLTAHGIFDFHLGDDHVITASAMFYGEDQINGPGAPARRQNVYLSEDVFFNWRQFGLAYEGHLPNNVNLRFDSSYSRRFQQQVAPPVPDFEPIDYQHVEDERGFMRVTATKPVGHGGLVTVGGGWNDLRILFTNFESIEPRVNDGLEQIELFGQYDRSLGRRWNVSFGGRYDEMLIYGKATRRFGTPPPDVSRQTANFLPRAQASFQATPKVRMSLAAGRFAVGPVPIAEKICCGAKLSRSVHLDPETAWSWQGQVEIHPTSNMRITATLFRTDFLNYIQRDVSESNFGVPTYELHNIRNARVQGIDLIHDMRFKENLFNVGWTYTYSDPEDGDGSWLPFLSRSSASAYLRFDQPKTGTLVTLDLRYQGTLRHFGLDASAVPRPAPPVGWRRADDYITGDVRAEQRIGQKGWAVLAGVSNIADYVQNDITDKDWNDNGIAEKYERCYDWGPLQGRVVFAGVKFTH